MNIAILGAAPHITACWRGRAGFDVLIGINRAAASIPCDFWCFGDMETPLTVTPLGSPRWATNENAARRLTKRGIAVPADALLWESLSSPGLAANWPVFSATAALVLARELGATRIECFGVVDAEPPVNEAPRWAIERRIWNEVVAWLTRQGIPVTRAPGS